MEYSARQILLKDGRYALVKFAAPEDSAQVLELLKTVSGETDFLLRTPEEWGDDAAGEETFLKSVLESTDQLMLNCWVEGALVGNASLTRLGPRKVRHRASVAIALRKSHWGLGLGKVLMEVMISQAKAMGVEILELDHIQSNIRARALYEKLGFHQVAVIPDAYRQPDGTSRASVMMMKYL